MPRDQNGNEISDEDRINRNMARFLSTEKQQKQLLLCLRQQEMPKRLRMGKLTTMTVACKNLHNYFNLHVCPSIQRWRCQCRW